MSKHVTISIHHQVGDDNEEWIVSDNGDEFDDEVYTTEDDDDTTAEANARDDAACRAIHYQQMGYTWEQDEVR